MKIYNKGGKSFIVAKNEVVSGPVKGIEDGVNQNKSIFAPGTHVEMKQEMGEWLLSKYPNDLIRVDTQSDAPQEEVKEAPKRGRRKKIDVLDSP